MLKEEHILIILIALLFLDVDITSRLYAMLVPELTNKKNNKNEKCLISQTIASVIY